MKKSSSVPFALLGCVALAISGCNPKSTADADAAKERQLQEMQDKLNALNSKSEDLSKQIAARDAADEQTRRDQLTKDQADVERQRADLEADRQALAASTPKPVRDEVADADADAEPVYQGKPSNYNLFYTKLQNDGDWIESADYGYIFQPSVATRNNRWRPYTDGRWVETDRGWTWDSNERFGWATYHYGRWVDLDGSGWCWVPGDQWAPAWVSWRSSDKYVGWAPLPPEARLERGGSINASMDVGYDSGPGYYNFVDTQDFGEDTYVGRVVEPERNVTIIDQTVNVTNISYNQTVINNYGPDYDQIGRRSRRPVERYRLDLDHRPDFADNSTHPRRQGDRLAVVAPVFVNNAREERDVRPVKVEKKIIKTEREKGWRGVDPAQRAMVQAQLKKQADQQAQRAQVAQQNKLQQQAVAQRQQARQAAVAQRAANAAANPAPNVPPAAAPQVMPREADGNAQRQRQMQQQRQAQEKAQQLARQKAQQENQARARAQQAQQAQNDTPNSPATAADPAGNAPADPPDRPKTRAVLPKAPDQDRDPQQAAAAAAQRQRQQQAAQAQRAQQAAQEANQQQRAQNQQAAEARQAAQAQQAARAQAQQANQAAQAQQAAQAARRQAAAEQARAAQPERRQPEDQPSNPGRAQQVPKASDQRSEGKQPDSDDDAKAERAKKRAHQDQPEQ